MQLGFDKAGRLAWHRHAHPSHITDSRMVTGALQSGDTGRAEIIVVLLFKKEV